MYHAQKKKKLTNLYHAQESKKIKRKATNNE